MATASRSVHLYGTRASSHGQARSDTPNHPVMPIQLADTAPTLLLRKDAFERVGLTRTQFDHALNLTDDEFRVEGGLIVVGPLVGETALVELIEQLEAAGLVFYEDFFELSGNWPAWLTLYARAADGS